jgi:hypothetical protein
MRSLSELDDPNPPTAFPGLLERVTTAARRRRRRRRAGAIVVGALLVGLGVVVAVTLRPDNSTDRVAMTDPTATSGARSIDGTITIPIAYDWTPVSGTPYVDVNSPEPVQSVDVATMPVDASPSSECDLPVSVLEAMGPADGYISARIVQLPLGNARPPVDDFLPVEAPESAYARCLAAPDSLLFKATGFTEGGTTVLVYTAVGRSAGRDVLAQMRDMLSQLRVSDG